MSSLQILISHTGQRLQADPSNYGSFEAFRSWVATKAGLTAQNVVFLSPHGRAVKKLETLVEIGSVFAYDGHIFQNSNDTDKSLVTTLSIPSRPPISQPPNAIKNETSIQSWYELFKERRSWAQQLVGDCARIQATVELRYRELDIFRGSITAALENVKSYTNIIDGDVAGAQAWHANLQRDYKDVLGDPDYQLARLQACPISNAGLHFIKGQDVTESSQDCTLQNLVNVSEVEAAAVTGTYALTSVKRDVVEIVQVMEQLRHTLDDVILHKEQMNPGQGGQGVLDSITLLEDIEALATKISSDCQHVLAFQNNQSGISQASKAALLHTRKHLPSLVERGNEIYDMLVHATELRNLAATDHIEAIRAITNCNTMCAGLTDRLDHTAISSEHHRALDLLQFVDRLPVTYASFLAEAVRRREWSDKIKANSSTKASDIATLQDEEGRRRRKWAKGPGALLCNADAEKNVPGLEVNLAKKEDNWPCVLRQDLSQYLEALRNQDFRAEVISEVTALLADLAVTTKQQAKRSNTFKNGSVHDLATSVSGQSTLLVRGDPDTIRSLQDDKAKLESRCRGAESRIRKLEGLLHKQMAQVPIVGSFQPSSLSPDLQELINPLGPPSPRLRNESRRPSVDSRRASVNYGQVDRAMAQKIIELEANLLVEKEKCAAFERELSARADSTADIKHYVKEIDATKQDLLQNLEAQRKEFDIERKSLLDEIKEHKLKIENYEDDVDRLLGSRETEKATVDEQIRDLQQEFDRERARFSLDVQKAQGQVDFLRNNAKLQTESNETLMERMQALQEDINSARRRAEKSEESSTYHTETLHTLYELLKLDKNVHRSGDTMNERIVQTVEAMVAESGNYTAKLQMTISQRDQAQAVIDEKKKEAIDSLQKLEAAEMELRRFTERVDTDKAALRSVESELADERDQLSRLRTQLSAGETGSGTLRIRLEEEERKSASLSKELASATCRIGNLEEELQMISTKSMNIQAKHDAVSERFEARTVRTRDLTQRLYAQNDRLRRLLERLSYSVIRDGDSMIIQRIPKVDRTSANDSSDPGTVARRSISGPTASVAAESADLDHLYWMHNDCQTESERFSVYMSTMGNFDVEAFCETMLKRVKDLEHTLRKHTRDARSYRERHQRAQKEASEKIAYKNFKDGDLALFLPTRNQATGAWAAFNVGAPHYFLHEQDSHKLQTRDWLLARIHKIEERVVDLAKSMTANAGDRASIGEASVGESYEDDNPFDLSDGLRWYLIDATEEKPGAPTTPGLGKSTAAVTSIDATGVIRRTKKSHTSGVVMDDVSKKLTRSLDKTLSIDSRRNSGNSKKAATSSLNSAGPASIVDVHGASKQLPIPSEVNEASGFGKIDGGGQSPSATIDDLVGP